TPPGALLFTSTDRPEGFAMKYGQQRLFALLAGLTLTGALPAAPAEAPANKAVAAGLAVELSVLPLDGGPLMEEKTARVRLTITDTLSGTPMSRLYPGAWMDLLDATLPGEAAETDCKKKVEALVSGSLLSRPDLDLNTYYVLTLNADATLSVVDPLFGYGNSKLLTMVFLKSPGEDWALADADNRLFVSMPEAGAVAAVDTATWKVASDIATGGRPRRLGLQPDGHYLWVARDGGVSAIDTAGLRKVADIPTGRGNHDLAFSDDSRFVFVTNEEDGTVSVLDTAKLAKLRDVQTGDRPVSVAWSAQAKRAYVSGSRLGSIVAIDGVHPEPLARVEAGPGLGRIRFAPGGRLAFVVHPAKNAVHILDAVTHRVIQTADVEAEPDQVTFSDELAYVRHRGSEIVLMIPLKTVGEPGRPVPVVDFPGGQHPPGRASMPTPADGIVQAPGHPSVLVVNPEDKVIYYYKEGMAAPMGHFQNYGKTPRAVLVVDRSLREVRPGVYETVATMGSAGRYDLALLIDSPRVVHCFPVAVAEDPVLAASRRLPLDVEVKVAGEGPVRAGEEVTVRLRINEPVTRAPRRGLRDVQVLTFLSPGTWQQRHWADEVAEGLYEIRFQPPEPGLYFVFVGVESAGLPLQKSQFVSLTVGEPAAAAGGSR
ncbi:MAG TPA: YncE family protein, partial [Thermoanaerobaculia bacterium]